MIVTLPALLAVPVGLAVGGAAGGGRSAAGVALFGVGYLVSLVLAIWSVGWRQGETGQSLGKGMVGIEVVSANDGRHIGGGLGIARWLINGFIGGLCFLNWLWPLWDDRNRAWHDMILSTSVVRRP